MKKWLGVLCLVALSATAMFACSKSDDDGGDASKGRIKLQLRVVK